MKGKHLVLIASLGSSALLIVAWIFQYFGFAPCQMCIWQRWPHGVAIVIGSITVIWPLVPLALLGAFAAATTGVIGIYHSGVERGFLEGPATCGGADTSGLSVDQLMEAILEAPLVRCDEIAWQLLGVTMANLNATLSLALAMIWLVAARKFAN